MSIGTLPEEATASTATSSRRREVPIATTAGALVLLATLVNFLNYNEYPLARPEVGLLALFLLAIAGGMGLFYAALGDLGRVTLQLLLVVLALDFNFGPTVAIGGAIAIGVLVNRHMMPFLAIVSAVVLATGLAGIGTGAGRSAASQAAPVPAGASVPALVHIIVDEHIGIEGLLGEDAATVAMREKLKTFYTGHGFHLMGGAYSEYLHTVNAIPQILNLGVQQERESGNIEGTRLERNAYFDRLGEMGYRIHVAETDFLDYCRNEFVVSCEPRRASNPHDILDVPIPTGEKFRLLGNEMAKLSRMVQGAAIAYDMAGVVVRAYGVPLPAYRLDTHRMPTAIGAVETLDRLTARLRQARPGEAFFVHELIPHYPYVFDGSCRLKATEEWHNRRAAGISKESRREAYFGQIGCLMTRLDALLAALAVSPAGDNAIVVIHGDHGSRITDIDAKVETEDSFADSDLIEGYATLFAVRAPGLAPGYESRRLPAARILGTLVASRFNSVDVALPADFEHSVVLENTFWEPVSRHPLPAWWVAAN